MTGHRSGLSSVDPELRAALSVIPDLSGLSDDTLADMRSLTAGGPVGSGDEAVSIRPVSIRVPGRDDLLPAFLYSPVAAGGVQGAILNIHGGGFVMGDAAREDGAAQDLVRALGCHVLCIDYRLAPEHPYPAALDDCIAALDWLHRMSDELGFDRERIAVRGVSAGGGLAAATALRTAGDSDLALAALVLLYPMLDDRTVDTGRGGDYVWTAPANRYAWNAYLQGRAADEFAAPARARQVERLPPTQILVGALDLFAQENLLFAGRLIAAGVPTEVHVYPGAYHGFALIPTARIARDCRDAMTAALRQAMTKGDDE